MEGLSRLTLLFTDRETEAQPSSSQPLAFQWALSVTVILCVILVTASSQQPSSQGRDSIY